MLEAEARQRSMLSQRQRRMLEDARRVLESPPEAKNVAFLQVRTLPLGPTLAYLTLILTLTLTLHAASSAAPNPEPDPSPNPNLARRLIRGARLRLSRNIP